MDYQSAKEYMNSLDGRGIVPGLDCIRLLLKKLNNPEKDMRIIHVAGTNGKGSFGAYLSSVTEAESLRCGRFVSPCVGEYANTFLINGKSVDKATIADATEVVKTAICSLEAQGVYPTRFIAETALAFVIFKMTKPDYVIIECGMGGKDDATNAIDSVTLSVITKISLDHTAFLGDTIESITTHKAGIIKPGTPVVSAIQSPNAAEVIKSACKMCGSVLYTAAEAQIRHLGTPSDNPFTAFTLSGAEYETRMLGTYQPENAALAIKAAEVLGFSQNAITSGIKTARWEYRFMPIGRYILDGAHNPDGAEALARSLKEYTTPADTAFICACFKDKDYNKIAELTAPYAADIYCINTPTPRGLLCDTLCAAFKKHNPRSYTASSLTEAIEKTKAYKTVVIFGTLSILKDAKDIIERHENNAAM